ncbi:MAG: HAMP domain-containing sensor histidine kinase, partial [Pseudohongiellaceae bacterium]
VENYENKMLPDILLGYLENWKINPHIRILPFNMPESDIQIQANFSYLTPGDNSNVLIFLEDYSLLSSRVQQLKLVSLGRLTASIAHEIRNPLGAISHASQLLTESSKLPEGDERLIEIIINHSNRINSIIENILQLSRNKGEVPELINLSLWLPQFISRFANSYNHPVTIDLELADDNIQIRVNPSQLEQLLTNLCDNGIRYSMKKTGREHLTVRVQFSPDGLSPYIDIIDEGEGIPLADRGKIFEPFFTTERSGTGLGLYICREICEANQAQISYLRTENQQSCFRISFTHPDRQIV